MVRWLCPPPGVMRHPVLGRSEAPPGKCIFWHLLSGLPKRFFVRPGLRSLGESPGLHQQDRQPIVREAVEWVQLMQIKPRPRISPETPCDGETVFLSIHRYKPDRWRPILLQRRDLGFTPTLRTGMPLGLQRCWSRISISKGRMLPLGPWRGQIGRIRAGFQH